MGSHRVGHHLVTGQQQSSYILYICSIAENQRGKKKDYFQPKHNPLVSCPRFSSTLNDIKLKGLLSRNGKAVGDKSQWKGEGGMNEENSMEK